MHLPKLTEASVLPSNIAEAGEMSRRDFVSAMFALGFCPIPLLGCDFLNNSGFKTLSETVCKNAHMPPLGQIIKTLDGGYAFPESTIIEGQVCAGVVKMNHSGDVEWHFQMKNIGTSPKLTGLLQTRNGDFYLLGTAWTGPELVAGLWPQPMLESGIYPAIIKINSAGQRVPYKVQKTLTPVDGCQIRYGIEVTDGLVFFGLKPTVFPDKTAFEPGISKVELPWIFKVNHTGEVVWEYLIQKDENQWVQDLNSVDSSFAKPIVDADGTIVVATVVGNVYRDPATGLFDTAMQAIQQNIRTLVIRINPADGKELSRGHIPSGYVCGFQPDGDTGFQFFSDGDSAERQGVSRFRLDKNLQVKSTAFIPVKDFNIYDVAPAGKPDEFYLLGDTRAANSDRTNATVLYLDQTKHIAHHIRYGRETNTGASLVVGNAPNEVVFVHQQQGIWYGDAHFTRLTVAN